MPPQTRTKSIKESRILRSKKVRFVELEGVRISLTRCDNTNNSSRTNNSPKKNFAKQDGKSTSKSLNSPKSKEKQKSQLSPKKKEPSTKFEEKPVEIKKPTAVKNHIRKLILEPSSPKIVKKDKESPIKPATTPENVKQHKQSPIKTTTTNKEISKSEIRIKKPLLKKALSKEKRLKKQMKLGRIFIKPTFPIKTILKREIHFGEKVENQGQFVTTDSTKELNNNNIVKRSTTQPKIVLDKIDEQAGKPTGKPRRETRKILRHL